MTTTETILNYAAMHGGAFHRKELLRDLAGEQTDSKGRMLDLQLSRLVASGKLVRKGRGEYQVAENSKPEFVYHPSESERDLFQRLKKQFPFLDFCIWSPQVLSSFMHHVPNVVYTFVDVEKVGMESVFHALQNMDLDRNVLLSPSAEECNRYLTGDVIVVRLLIGQSPLMEVDGCMVPRIEKILVDAVGDNELFYTSGSEIYYIYQDVFERVNVNKSKLMRYASRRNRKEQIERIIKTVEHDQSSV